MEHGEYQLKPRAREVRWHWGTKKEFLNGKPRTKRLPGDPKPPLMLATEDEVIFRLDEQK